MGDDLGDSDAGGRTSGLDAVVPRPRAAPSDHEVAVIEQVTERLANRYAALPSGDVARVVAEVHHGFDEARVRDFVPILVEQEARRRLEHTAAPSVPA
jgi:hypothetical protein